MTANPKATRRWKRKLGIRVIVRVILLALLIAGAAGLALWLLQRWAS